MKSKPTRLAIVTTHPIQYNSPLFSLLAMRESIDLKVFYTWGEGVLQNKFDPGFGKSVSWDIPLLEGYEYQFVENIAAKPGSHNYRGINNPTLINEIKKWDADAILVYGWNFKSHLKCIRYFHKKVPVYFRGDSTLLGRNGSLKAFARRSILKWVYSHVDIAFYVGTDNKEYYLKYGLQNDQLVFAPHAVDNQRFFDRNGLYEEEAKQWRKKLGILPEELVIVYAGKLEPIKNLDWLIDTIEQEKDLNIKLILVGNGPLEKYLKEKSAGDDRFLFIDFQNQQMMPVVYRLGPVFILCSRSETWGLAINEAMASGRAILASETCGCVTDLVEDGTNGYIFKITDSKDLINKIKDLAGNITLVKSMGIESQSQIIKWNFEEVCEAIENTTCKLKSD